MSGLRKNKLQKSPQACRDALAGLPHDHCAKCLAHRLIETSALLSDEAGVAETWREYRNYFNGNLEEGEWFAPRRKHLLTEALVLARALKDDRKLYEKTVRRLWWKMISEKLTFADSGGEGGSKVVNFRWWWVLIWFLLMLLRALHQ